MNKNDQIKATLSHTDALEQVDGLYTVGVELMQTVNGPTIRIPHHYAMVRRDMDQVIGVNGSRYTVTQNEAAFDIASTLSDMGYIERAGVLFGGSKAYMMVRMPDVEIGGQKVANYIHLTNSFDGSSAMTMRSVLVLGGHYFRHHTPTIKIKHTASSHARMKIAGTLVTQHQAYLEMIGGKAADLASQAMTDKQLGLFLEALWPTVGAIGRGYTTACNAQLAFRQCVSYPDLAFARGSAWGAVMAAARYVDEYQDGRTTATGSLEDNQTNRILYGPNLVEKVMTLLETGAYSSGSFGYSSAPPPPRIDFNVVRAGLTTKVAVEEEEEKPVALSYAMPTAPKVEAVPESDTKPKPALATVASGADDFDPFAEV